MSFKQSSLFLVAIGYTVFFNSLFNGFVWDDDFQIVHNAAVQTGDVLYYFARTIGPYYRPLMLALYTILFQIFQTNTFFYHFPQVSIHIGNAILLLWLFRHFFKATILSFLMALLFLIHPINVEPVVYIANLQDVLFMFFGLVALYISITNRLGKYSNLSVTVLLFLALLTKETAILFVIVICVYVIIYKKRQRIVPIIYASSTVILYIITRLSLVGAVKPGAFNVIPQNTIIAASFGEKLLTMPKTICFYFLTLFYPANLTDQVWFVKTATIQDFFLPLFLIILLFLSLIWFGFYLKEKKSLLVSSYWFFLLWFTLGLGFHLNLLPLDKTVADRWFYFPFIGLLGIFISILQSIKTPKSNAQKNIVIVLIITIYCCLAIRTMVRNTNWYSNLTLFSHDVHDMEDVADIHYNYGSALSQNGQYDDAIIEFNKAAQLVPDSFMVQHNLGIAYLHKQDYTKALASFQKATIVKPDTNMSYHGIVYSLLLEDKTTDAKKAVEKYLKTFPSDFVLWRMYGLIAYKLNNKQLAETAFKKSYSLVPDPVTNYYFTQLEQNLPLEYKEL